MTPLEALEWLWVVFCAISLVGFLKAAWDVTR